MPNGPYTGEGNFGDIPDEIILRKYETTCMYENPEDMEYHQRRIMRDESPDRPFMESDEPRSGGIDPRTGEQRRGGSWSRERLALRGIGRRSYAEPYLPDGTFLDMIGGGLEKDPRSLRPDPDFREYARQGKFRTRYTNFYNDDDMSVPETGISPAEYFNMIRGSQRWVKDRLKIFSTGKDNWTQKTLGNTIPTQSKAVQVTTDGEIINLSDATRSNKTNLVDLLTNKYNIGWARTPDQEFKIAKYGQIRPSANIADQKWYKAIRKGIDDRIDADIFQDQVVPKTMVLMLENVLRARDNLQQTEGDIPWRSSHQLKNYKENIKSANYRGGKIGYNSVEDRATEIVRLLQDAYVRRKDAMLAMPDKPDSRIGVSWIDPQIIQFMELANRKPGPHDTQMILKDAALMERIASGLQVHDKDARIYTPASIDAFEPTESLWKSKDFRHVDPSLVAATYSNIAPVDWNQPFLNLVDQEDYKSRSDKSLYYRQRILPPDSLTQGYIMPTQEFDEPLDRPGHMNGTMGSKYTRRYVDNDIIHGEVDDAGMKREDN